MDASAENERARPDEYRAYYRARAARFAAQPEYPESAAAEARLADETGARVQPRLLRDPLSAVRVVLRYDAVVGAPRAREERSGGRILWTEARVALAVEAAAHCTPETPDAPAELIAQADALGPNSF